MYNQVLLAGIAGVLVIATVFQVGAGRRALRNRSLDALRAAVSAWLVVVAAAFVAVNTLTSHVPSGPSLAYVTPRNINVVPFRTIVGYIGELEHLRNIALRNLLGNLVLFAPAGAALALHPGVHGKRAVGLLAATSALVEILQMVLARGSDIDDIILNTLGGAAAFAIVRFAIARLTTSRRLTFWQ